MVTDDKSLIVTGWKVKSPDDDGSLQSTGAIAIYKTIKINISSLLLGPKVHKIYIHE